MGRRQRLRARHGIGAVVEDTADRAHTQAHFDDASNAEESMKRPPTRAQRTTAARERAAGHQPGCTCGAAQPVGNWYRIENYAGTPSVAVVYIYQEIGYWGTTAQDFVQELNALRVDELHIHINSPGGEVDDGIAIYNAIRNHPARTVTHVDGLAASAASFIALAANEVRISPNAQMMIHDAMGLEFGNAAEMRAFADLLDRYSDNIADIYARKSGMPAPECRELMRVETWFTGAEAVAAGMCDMLDGEDMPGEPMHEPDEGEQMAFARWDLSLYEFRHQGRAAAPPPPLRNHGSEAPTERQTTDAPEDTPSDTSDVVMPDVSRDESDEPRQDDGQPALDSPPTRDVPAPADDEPAGPEADAESADETPQTAAAALTDTWAQAIHPLISATSAPADPVDAFAELTRALKGA